MSDGLVGLGTELIAMTPGQLAALVPTLEPEEQQLIATALADPDVEWAARRRRWVCERVVCDGKPHAGWPIKHSRTNQRAPLADWLVWFFMAGRGAGKTRSHAEEVSERIRTGVWSGEVAFVQRTLQDVRATMMEGDTGILSVVPEGVLKHGSRERAYNRGEVRLTFRNGTVIQGYSSESPQRLRGRNLHGAWVDEPATLIDAHLGIVLDPRKDVTWTQLMLSLRAGKDPRCLVSGTPKRVKLVKDILAQRGTVLTKGSTYDNIENLAQSYIETVIVPYEGTTLGRQELHGHLLDEVEGALVTNELLEATRVGSLAALAEQGVVILNSCVAVDPSGSKRPTASECGIVAVGVGDNLHGYVLDDVSLRGSPEAWAERALRLWHTESYDKVVYESNFGGEMARSVLQAGARGLADAGELPSEYVPIESVHASTGKHPRAQPVGLLFQQRRAHIVGSMPELEDQWTTWVPGDDSPDRLDASVWGFHAVVLGRSRGKARTGAGALTGTQLPDASAVR